MRINIHTIHESDYYCHKVDTFNIFSRRYADRIFVTKEVRPCSLKGYFCCCGHFEGSPNREYVFSAIQFTKLESA